MRFKGRSAHGACARVGDTDPLLLAGPWGGALGRACHPEGRMFNKSGDECYWSYHDVVPARIKVALGPTSELPALKRALARKWVELLTLTLWRRRTQIHELRRAFPQHYGPPPTRMTTAWIAYR